MAVDLTEGTTFAPAVTVPQPGDDRKAASVDLPFQQLTDRTRYLLNTSEPRNYDVSRAPYSAVGSGAVNDYPAIAAAAADAMAAGGGTLWLTPGKAYRLDSELVLDGTVSIRVAHGLVATQPTRLIRNHNGRLLKNNGALRRIPAVFEGFKCIEGAVASTEAMIENTGGSLTLSRLWLFGTTTITNGPLFYSRCGETAVSRVRECTFQPDTGGNGIKHTVGLLDVSGSTFVAPATYSGRLIDINSTSSFDAANAIITGNDFYATQVTSGSPLAIVLDGLWYSATVSGNHFRGAAAHPLVCMAWGSTGVRSLYVGRNSYVQCLRYSAGGTTLQNDSKLDLGSFKDAAGATYVIPDGYEDVALVGSGNCAIQLPGGLVENQLLRLTFVNDTVGPATVTFAVTPLTATGGVLQPGAGQTLTGMFTWQKPLGSGIYSAYRWIQIGTWGVGTTLV